MQLTWWLAFARCTYGFQSNQQPTQHNLGFPPQDVIQDASTLSSKPKNYAAIIPSPEAQLEVTSVPYPEIGDDELIIKNYVVAINPVDWKIQGPIGRNFDLSYPVVLGEDVAGEIVEVGSKLKSNFSVGDRVMAHPLGLTYGSAYGGFQLYPVLKGATVSKIPDSITFEQAAVLPLSISTAAAGLFMDATLALEYPSPSPKSEKVNSSTLLVWGCSSSVGSSVVQLAHAAGYSVITTASPTNYQYCKKLGADEVLNYHDADIIPQIIDLLKGTNIAGVYDAIGSETTIRQSATILHALGGGKIASVGLALEIFDDVKVTRISSGNIVTQEPDVARKIWGEYVPWALEHSVLVPNPEPLVVGKGLESLQKGLDRQKEGVSARKVEVLLA